ncbi:C4-dicarboxylate ABC transporter substrate-binding protein [Petrocella atlantisensis]|uniref:C4-dicarboxylate ABC transporter substrate-binding protein n=1 Tax=Petrocella atlantisensis TaxID=2173034 RepID=A0A3P7S1A5_9FIRM|nr:TRAP transporter substrate-binding protein [Petrocella atlantisensis]VDN48472.1 C4-dicarboxylate ABC transporter substrate-binding protein [Petrocella atlantisensis]
MKKLLSMLLVAVMIMSLAGCASEEAPSNETDETEAETTGETTETETEAPAAEVITLRVAHNQTSLDNPYQFGLNKFAEEIARLSGGTIVAEVFPGTLGTNENELAMKLTTDSVDMVVASPGFMAGTGVQEFDLLSLLYLFDSFDHWETTIDGEFGDTMKDLIVEKTNNDFKVVGYYSSGVRNYYGKKPITVPSDSAGLNIRLQGSPVQQEFWKSAGANPISVGWAELYQALNTGTADAAENDHTNMMLQGHHTTDNGKYTSLTYHDYTTRLLLMNGHAFDKFTEEQQGWILEAAEASVAEERAVTYKMLDESRDKILADGGEINEVDLEAFKTLALPIQDKYAEENNLQDLLELTRK